MRRWRKEEEACEEECRCLGFKDYKQPADECFEEDSSSESESESESDPLGYPHYRLTVSAKREEALHHASTDYSTFRLARWSYQVYVPLPSSFSTSQAILPPIIRGQHFQHLTTLTMSLRPMEEN